MTNAMLNAVIVSVVLQTNWYSVPDCDKEVGIITEKCTYLINGELIKGNPKILPIVPLLRDPGPRFDTIKYYTNSPGFWWHPTNILIIPSNLTNYNTLELR